MLDSLLKSIKKKKKDRDQRNQGEHNQRVEDVLPQESEETGSQPYLPAFTASTTASAVRAIPKESPSLENSEEPLPAFTPPHELIQQGEDMWHVGSPPGVHQYRRKF
ncbi:MAG: hypothetical protein AB7D28_07605 [Candidatus Berkiella sp.]